MSIHSFNINVVFQIMLNPYWSTEIYSINCDSPKQKYRKLSCEVTITVQALHKIVFMQGFILHNKTLMKEIVFRVFKANFKTLIRISIFSQQKKQLLDVEVEQLHLAYQILGLIQVYEELEHN